MFGFIYLMIMFIPSLLAKISENKYNQELKLKVNNEYKIYYDRKGRTIDYETDKPVVISRNKENDTIVTNCLDINRNISDEKRWKKYYELKKLNNPLVTVMEWNRYSNHIADKIPGVRYRDLNTGMLMVVREVDGNYYYMSVDNSKFIRKTDGQKFFDLMINKNPLEAEKEELNVIKTNGKDSFIKIVEADKLTWIQNIEYEKTMQY